MYQVLIVDDEFLARKLLQGYVEKIPELTLAGTAQNAFEAFSFIKEHHVDVLLLDIHMPDLNGIELARMLKDVPAIIFTTAYSEYALESYEVSAVDYLLKPVTLPRFIQAIDKAIVRINGTGSTTTADVNSGDETTTDATTLTTTTETSEKEKPTEAPNHLMVKADYRYYKINFDDLLYIEGQHEYVSFYTTKKRITALYSLKTLEEQLPADRFVRIHKSYIVSLDHVTEVDQLTVVCADQKLPIGGSYRELLQKKLGI